MKLHAALLAMLALSTTVFADHYEKRCTGGSCQLVLVRDNAPSFAGQSFASPQFAAPSTYQPAQQVSTFQAGPPAVIVQYQRIPLGTVQVGPSPTCQCPNCQCLGCQCGAPQMSNMPQLQPMIFQPMQMVQPQRRFRR